MYDDEDYDWDEFGENHIPIIRRWIELRKEKGLTQKQLAQKMDMNERDIIEIEKGCKSIRPLNIIRFCDVLDIPPNDFYKKEVKEGKLLHFPPRL